MPLTCHSTATGVLSCSWHLPASIACSTSEQQSHVASAARFLQHSSDNVFGPNTITYESNTYSAWVDCSNELEEQKLLRGVPDMKMVVSMSFSGQSSTSSIERALIALARNRTDVLYVAAAGNDGSNVTNYPAALREVVSVSAVSWTKEVASFSTFNSDVEW